MSDWINFAETPPKNGDIIDVWAAYIDDETGRDEGYRCCNCWVSDGKVFHGKHVIVIRFVTHYMSVPKSPFDNA